MTSLATYSIYKQAAQSLINTIDIYIYIYIYIYFFF
jgi:hypothetical protein